MKLSGILPYGRSFSEYALMFSLQEQDASKRILGVGDGPSSFNREATLCGWNVTSVDPLYAFSVNEVSQRCKSVMGHMIASVQRSPQHWIWRHFRDARELEIHRLTVLQDFEEDFRRGAGHRYVCGALPELPFKNGAFDLALCSHVLFSWEDLLGPEFHEAAILEMLRVAHEIRIYPIRRLNHEMAAHVKAVRQMCEQGGLSVRLQSMGTPPLPGTEQLIIATESHRAAQVVPESLSC